MTTTAIKPSTRVLILPGWQNSGQGHWQTLWEAAHGYERVMQHDWMHPLRGDWITHLEDYLLLNNEHSTQTLYRVEAENALKNGPKSSSNASTANIVFVAHSLGCHLVAAWAAMSKNTHRVKGALLVAPPDGVRDDFPPQLKSWRPAVLDKLPFPSICVISSDDPFCDLLTGRAMANAWGSECIELGARGHINAASGLGGWPQGQALLAQLMQ